MEEVCSIAKDSLIIMPRDIQFQMNELIRVVIGEEVMNTGKHRVNVPAVLKPKHQ